MIKWQWKCGAGWARAGRRASLSLHSPRWGGRGGQSWESIRGQNFPKCHCRAEKNNRPFLQNGSPCSVTHFRPLFRQCAPVVAL